MDLHKLAEAVQINDEGVPYLKVYVGFGLAVYLFHTYLAVRQLKAISKPDPPKELAEQFPGDKYKKIQAYSKDKWWFGLFKGLCGHVQQLLMLLTFLLPTLWAAEGEVMEKLGLNPQNEILHSIVHALVVAAISLVVDLPWSIYSQFGLEQRHGFNKMGPGLFASDLVKQVGLTLVLAPPIVAGMTWILLRSGPLLPIYLYIFILVLQLFMLTIFPTVIQPLFNKYSPMEAGPLKEAIEKLAQSLRFPLKKLFVVDGSKRSAHSNAYMFGFFNNKRIVLYDTLLQQASQEQVVAVLAHELGHWKLSHTITNFVASNSVVLVQLLLFMLIRNSQQLYREFGWNEAQPALVAFLLYQDISEPLSEVVGLAFNFLSRRHEFQADEFAVKLGHGEHLRGGLLVLQEENKSSLHADPWYSAYHFSHPPLLERLRAIDTKMKKKD